MTETTETETRSVKLSFEIIRKSAENADDHFIVGWASMTEDADGRAVIDLEGDYIPVEELRKAAHRYIREFGLGGEMHEGDAPNICVESVITDVEFQKAFAHDCPSCGTKIEKFAPIGWFVKYKCDAELVRKVRTGGRLQFSIEGRAQRVPVVASA